MRDNDERSPSSPPVSQYSHSSRVARAGDEELDSVLAGCFPLHVDDADQHLLNITSQDEAETLEMTQPVEEESEDGEPEARMSDVSAQGKDDGLR